MTQQKPPPPSRTRPRRSSHDQPRCGVCSKLLRMDDIHGVDNQLGPVCRECGPHVIAANKLMYPFYV